MFYYISLGIGVIISLIFVFFKTKGNSVHVLIFKAVSSLFFLLTAVFATIENSGPAYKYGPLIIMGGALGLVGDILLDLKGVYKKDANDYLKGGFIFFFLGHIFYFCSLIIQNGLKCYLVLICVILSVLTALIYVSLANVMKIHYGKYKGMVFIYVIFLTMTLWTSIISLITVKSKAMLLMAIGALCLTVSDIILSKVYFGMGIGGKKKLVFADNFLYYAGQYLIASSILFVM